MLICYETRKLNKIVDDAKCFLSVKFRLTEED